MNNNPREELDAAFEAALKSSEGNADKEPVIEPARDPAAVDPPAAEKPADPAVSGDKPAAKEADKPADSAPKKHRSLEPPVRWTKEEKEQWESMVDDGMDEKTAERIISAQKVFLARNKSLEGWLTKEMQDVKSVRDWKQGLEGVLGQHRATWAQHGLDDASGLKQILDGFSHFNQDPVGFIKWAAQQRGIDLAKTFGATGAPKGDDGEDVQLHPAVKAHLDAQAAEISKLRAQLGTVGGAVTQRQQQEEAALATRVQTELQAFETEADEHGQPKHPFFNAVRQDMARLIGAGMADSYADAYDKAVYARPDLRSKLLESHELKIKREMEEKLKADAAAARKRSGGIPGSGGGNAPSLPAATNDGSVRALLEASIQAQLNAGRV